MPGLFRTRTPLRARARELLNARLISQDCTVCPARAGDGCDYYNDDRELLVQLDRDPPLFAHVPRIAQATAAHPAIRRLVLAQFGKDQAPAALTGEKT